MPIRTHVAAPAAILIAAVCALPAISGQPKVYRIAAEGVDAKKKPVPAETLTFETGGLRLTIRYLDGPQRRTALASVLGREVELFPERTATSRGFLVFALEIENRGASDAIFEPGQGRLVTDRTDAEFPLDYSGIYALLEKMPGAPELADVERAVYSRAATLRAGGAVRKLLVFEGPREEKFRKFEVRLGALHLADGDADAKFPFRRWEVKP